jgi:hypothetical protein
MLKGKQIVSPFEHVRPVAVKITTLQIILCLHLTETFSPVNAEPPGEVLTARFLSECILYHDIWLFVPSVLICGSEGILLALDKPCDICQV